jgi:hypothetical protein
MPYGRKFGTNISMLASDALTFRRRATDLSLPFAKEHFLRSGLTVLSMGSFIHSGLPNPRQCDPNCHPSLAQMLLMCPLLESGL